MSGVSFGKLKKALDILDVRSLRLKVSRCPMHGNSVFVKLNNSLLGVRCVVCGAAPIATSIASVLVKYEPDFVDKRIYELSSRGAFFEFLNKNVKDLVCSEYMEDVAPGESVNGVQCQDVQKLTFDDAEFEVCTSTEVFEHVPDDISGFKEICRVLKDDGVFFFTVPLYDEEETVERATIKDGEIIYLMEPEYHDDSIRGVGKVLVFHDYGQDIVDRLLSAGFSSVDIIVEKDSAGFGYEKSVIVARKGRK